MKNSQRKAMQHLFHCRSESCPVSWNALMLLVWSQTVALNLVLSRSQQSESENKLTVRPQKQSTLLCWSYVFVDKYGRLSTTLLLAFRTIVSPDPSFLALTAEVVVSMMQRPFPFIWCVVLKVTDEVHVLPGKSWCFCLPEPVPTDCAVWWYMFPQT